MGDLSPKAMLGRAPTLQEQEFQKWFADISKKLDLNPNPDDPENYYDYRGFYDAMKRGEYKAPTEPGGHWASKFKSPNHPRRYLEDPINARFFDTENGRYTGGDKSEISEKRMDLLNRVDTPDLPITQWKQAQAGANRAPEKILDPWENNPEKKSEIIDPWEI